MLNDKIVKYVGTLRNFEYSPSEAVPPSRKSVFIFLLAYADWKGHDCYPGIPRLARETGYSERTVQASLHDLERWGHVKKTFSGCRGDGKGRGRLANVYEVIIPQELLPARYRTNQQPLPESRQGLNGNRDGLTGNEPHDQPATIATQDSHKKISIKQDNERGASDDAGASLSFEEEIKKGLAQKGVRESQTERALREHGPIHVAGLLGILQQWEPTPEQAPGAFEKAGQQISRQAGGNGSLTLPKDDSKLVAFADAHQLPDARPGEEYFDYRSRLNAAIQQRRRDQ